MVKPMETRARVILLALGIVWIGFGLFFAARLADTLHPPLVYAKDLVQEYVFGQAVLHGDDPYATFFALEARYVPGAPAIPGGHATPHPPPAGLLTLPLSRLSFSTAAAIWLGIEVLCLLASVYLLLRQGRVRFAPGVAVGVTVALIAWPPVFNELAQGQLTLPILLLVVGARAAFRSGRDGLGGALLGAALAIKPLAWPLVLALALRRRWRGVGAASLVVGLAYAISGAIVGVVTVRDYLIKILPSVGAIYARDSQNVSLWTVGYRLFAGVDSWTSVPAAAPLVARPGLAPLAGAALPLALVVGCLWATRRLDLDRALGALLLVSVVVSPMSWLYDQALALVPISQVLADVVRTGFPRRRAIPGMVVAELLLMPSGLWSLLAVRSSGQVSEVPTPAALPFAAGLITLMPTFALLILLGLALLGQPKPEVAAGEPEPARGEDQPRRGVAAPVARGARA